MVYILLFAVIAFFVWYLFAGRLQSNLTGKCTYLDRHHISAQELFQKIKGEIEARNLPVKADIKSMFESGVLSKRREYLHVDYLDNAIDVSCGFFGDGSYVAWHLFQKDPAAVNRIPILSTLLGKNQNYQSFFRADTMASFQTIVRDIVETEIQSYAETNGIRPLRVEEMQGSKKQQKQLA